MENNNTNNYSSENSIASHRITSINQSQSQVRLTAGTKSYDSDKKIDSDQESYSKHTLTDLNHISVNSGERFTNQKSSVNKSPSNFAPELEYEKNAKISDNYRSNPTVT